jgi:hypothetical protein
MDLRTAISTWAGAGAAENARRSLDEWSRAQDEVAALLDRLEQRNHLLGKQPTSHSVA